MADFPAGRFHKPTISSFSVPGVGPAHGALNSAAIGSGVWPAQNRALYVPFKLDAPYSVTKMWWANGATVSANVDGGVYTVGGTLLGSIGSTVQAGTSVVQSATLSLRLQPGSYYMALALSTGTGTLLRSSATAATVLATLGLAQQATAFPLPATATFAAVTSSYIPLFGIASASVI